MGNKLKIHGLIKEDNKITVICRPFKGAKKTTKIAKEMTCKSCKSIFYGLMILSLNEHQTLVTK